jgi:hypothetical protein
MHTLVEYQISIVIVTVIAAAVVKILQRQAVTSTAKQVVHTKGISSVIATVAVVVKLGSLQLALHRRIDTLHVASTVVASVIQK